MPVFKAILALLVVGAAASSAVVAQEYTAIPISCPQPICGVTGLNNQGHVTFWAGGSMAYWGYLWNGQTSTQLPSLYSGDYTYPRGLNDSDKIVGSSDTSTGRRPVTWSAGNGSLVPLGSIASSDAYVGAINNAGTIAGITSPSGGRHLFTMSAEGQLSDQGHTPSYYLAIKEMNASGQIVLYDPGPLTDGYLWSNAQWTRLFDLAGSNYSVPSAINDNGLIVGMSWPNQQNQKAVCWRDGQISALPVPADTISSRAYDVNNLGQIVGNCTTASRSGACLWDPDGTFHFLADCVPGGSSLQLNTARLINDAGQIVTASSSGGGPVYLLTPEPATLSLLALGGLAVLRRRGRK